MSALGLDDFLAAKLAVVEDPTVTGVVLEWVESDGTVYELLRVSAATAHRLLQVVAAAADQPGEAG